MEIKSLDKKKGRKNSKNQSFFAIPAG